MKTIILDRTTWDLVVDLLGNIALASEPYALAQDAASAIKLFQAELYYDTTRGVPYWASILGRSPPPIGLLKQKLVDAALTVPGVVAAQVFVSGVAARTVSGQVQVTDAAGRISTASF